MEQLAKFCDSDIALMRKSFDTKMSELVNIKRKRGPYEWRKKDWIEEIIGIVYKFDPTKPHIAKYGRLAEKFTVVERNGVKTLVGTKRFHDNKQPHYVAVEDYFDVLYDAHIKGRHASYKKMQTHLISKNIYIPCAAKQFFLKLCKVCQKGRSPAIRRLGPQFPLRPRKNAKDHHGFVELIDMRKQPDGDYTCVMHYKDMATDFTYLRPLRSPQAAEVAEELLRMFVLIGCPGILHSPTSKCFIKTVIQKLTVAWPDCFILCGEQMKPMRITDKIEENLLIWMKRNHSDSWSLGVYVVAHRMNLIKKRKAGKIYRPYKSLLGANPKKGLNKRGLMSLKDIKYEEDLEKVVNVDLLDASSESSIAEGDNDTGSDDCNAIGLGQVKHPVKTYLNKAKLTQTNMDKETRISKVDAKPDPASKEIKSSNIQTSIGLNNNKTNFVRTYSKSKTKEATVAKPKPQFIEETVEVLSSNLGVGRYRGKPIGGYKIRKQIQLWNSEGTDLASCTDATEKTEEVFCDGANLRVGRYKDRPVCSKNIRKQIQLWNSDVIDLPSSSTEETEIVYDIALKNCDGEYVGEIPKSSSGCDMDPLKLEKDDFTEDVKDNIASEFIKDIRFDYKVKVEYLPDENISIDEME